MIDELAKVIDVSLALSLHAPNDALRSVGSDQQEVPLDVLLAACKRYVSRRARSAC